MDRSDIQLSRRQFIAGTGAIGLTSVPLSYAINKTSTHSLPEKRPEIIGHRGVAGLEPPNTMVGINKALEIGADGVELDVQQTQDGDLVLFHDPVLNISSNGEGTVNTSSTKEVLQIEIHGEPLITLEAALERLRETNAKIYLELKYPGYSEKAVKEVNDYSLLDQTEFVSFDEPALTPIVDMKNVSTGLIGSAPSEFLINDAAEIGADSVFSHYVPNVMEEFVIEANNKQLKAGIWSLFDTEQSISNALDAQPDILTTNRPDSALNELKQRTE